MTPIRTLTTLAALCLLALPLAAGQTPPWQGNGSLTLHDDPDTEATIDVADCIFWIRGHDIVLANGTVDVYEDHGRDGSELIVSIPYEGTPSGDGRYDVLVGPIEIGARARVYAEIVIEPAETPGSDPARYVFGASGEVHCGEQYIPCIEDLTATVLADGSVRLDWTASANATLYHVQRSDGVQMPNGRLSWETIGNTSGTTFLDTTAPEGERIVYDIMASDGQLANAEACRLAVVTPTTEIPFFPTTGGLLLGMLGVVGGAAVVLARRGR